jgi:hypothetical protein
VLIKAIFKISYCVRYNQKPCSEWNRCRKRTSNLKRKHQDLKDGLITTFVKQSKIIFSKYSFKNKQLIHKTNSSKNFKLGYLKWKKQKVQQIINIYKVAR